MPDLVTLLLLAGATARLSRLATTDGLTERPRLAVWSWVAQPRKIRRSAAQGEPIPPPTGLRSTLLTLLQCRWCISFWIALGVIGTAYAAHALHPWALTTATVLAAALSLSYATGWLADNEAPEQEEEYDA